MTCAQRRIQIIQKFVRQDIPVLVLVKRIFQINLRLFNRHLKLSLSTLFDDLILGGAYYAHARTGILKVPSILFDIFLHFVKLILSF